MATNLVVNFIGKNQLSKTTAVVNREFIKLNKTVDTASKSINKALGAAGIGLGLASVTSLLKKSTKAASDDRKSQGLLAQALKNTVGATTQAIAGAEKYIKKTQLQTAVLDDELRPALATAVRATGSLSKGQKLLDTALNVSAGTGKDLGTVTNAISKAFNGNTASLKKLLPSIKDGSDFMAQLDKQFKGAAETAANLDPYKRLEVIFADLQETIGEALLPALEEFSAYLVTPAGQKNIKQVVDLFIVLGKAVANISTLLLDNINLVKALVASVITAKITWGLLSGAVRLYTMVTGNAVVATKALKYALVSTGIGAVIALVSTLAAGWLEAADNQEAYYGEVYGGTPYVESSVPFGPGIAGDGTSWIALGFASEDDYLASLERTKQTVIDNRDKALKAIAETGKKFRDAVGLSFGLFGKDENSVFNVDVVIAKLKRVVDAAKGFAGNLKRLKDAGAGQNVIDQIIALGPAQGNIVAKGLLQSGGKLSQYLGLSGSLQATGEAAQKLANDTADKTYTVNINKANVSAEDIIKAIRTFEKKSGRKYFVAN